MNQEWNETPVLCSYDVRGIQNYIFRTNRISDIMGGSKIIENIIMTALKDTVESLKIENVLLDWEDWEKDKESLRFLQDTNVQIQVLYVGGGNAYAMYRTGKLASQVNRKMARFVLEKSYSLQLATASVKYEGKYSEDFRKLSRKMAEVKGSSPVSRVTGALPIMQIERATGFPAIEQFQKYGVSELIGYETKLKRMVKKQIKEGEEKHLDALITEKGVESMVAVIHLDGNNMGSRILHLMRGIDDYTEAIQKIRQISKNINESFKDTLKEMCEYIEKQAASHKAFQNKKNNIFVRPLVAAGDDITFISNASVALAAVEYFCKNISQKVLYQEMGKPKDYEAYGFSVCAGIAYVNSHFPFHSAYKIAEACCDKAKERAKEEQHKTSKNGIERVGNWVDFQICRSLQALDLKAVRKKEYQLYDGSELCLRPYYISVKDDDKLNEQCKLYDFSIFKCAYQYFSDPEKMPRSQAKEFRNTYPLGKYEVEALQTFVSSRGRIMPEKIEQPFCKDGKKELAVWFDALEFMDYYIELNEEKFEIKSRV